MLHQMSAASEILGFSKRLCSIVVEIAVECGSWASLELGRNRFESALYRYLENDSDKWGRKSLLRGSIIAQVFLLLVRWLWVRFFLWPRPEFEERAILIKSFAYSGAASSGHYRDPFFGGLPGLLSEKVGFVHLGLSDYRTSLRMLSRLRSDKFDFYAVEHFFGPIQILDAARSCRDASRRIEMEIQSLLESGVQERGFLAWLKEGGSRSGWRFVVMEELHRQIGRGVARRLKPRVVLMTHEGNGWERSWIQGLKEVDPSIAVIGFQHSVMPNASLGHFETEEELASGCCPDSIVCNGRYTARVMRERSARPAEQIIEGCALRFQYLYVNGRDTGGVKNGVWPPSGMTVLVAVEGAKPGIEMVKFIIHCAARLKDWTFRLRPHPSFGWEVMKDQVAAELPENVVISDSKYVSDDIEISDVLFYWGSAVSLEAVLSGIPLIRYTPLDGQSGLSYDPLDGLLPFKWCVDSEEAFASGLNDILAMTKQTAETLSSEAKAFVREYLVNPERNELDKLVELIEAFAENSCSDKRSRDLSSKSKI